MARTDWDAISIQWVPVQDVQPDNWDVLQYNSTTMQYELVASWWGASTLWGLTDVDTTGVWNGDVITYNSTTSEREATALAWWGDMLAATYDPTNVSWDAFSMDNMVEWATTKILTATERTKLTGIETGADVTDTANVTAAWALMDSEVTNLAQVKAFDSSDYATAAQWGLADSALQSGDIGSTVQAWDTHLDALAWLTPSSSLIIGDGLGGWATVTPNNFKTNNNILDTADIGVSVQAYDADTAKLDVAQEYTRTQNFNATTLTDWATINRDLSQNQVTSVTLWGNRTMAAPTNLVDWATYILTVKQDATGSRTITWNAVFKRPWGTAPTLTTTANAVDIITFVCDGTNLRWVASLDFS